MILEADCDSLFSALPGGKKNEERSLDWNQTLSDLKKAWEKICDLKHSQDSAEGIQSSPGKNNCISPLQIPQQVIQRDRYFNAGLIPSAHAFQYSFLYCILLFSQ